MMLMPYDILTMGEALLRLTPPHYQRFEQTKALEMHIGGSELNTAIGLARMGMAVRWFSRLTDNLIGRHIARELTAQGVDTSLIRWTPHDRTGIYYMEEGKAPRPSQVIYDRAGSAMSHITIDDVDLDGLLVDSPHLFHVSGITLAISQTSAESAQKLWQACQTRGIKLSFDINYRAKLWSTTRAREVCELWMLTADLIFIPERDAMSIYGTSDLLDLHGRYPQATLIMTRGAQGASAITPTGEHYHQAVYPVETVCRIGGGDAFSAGYLYGVVNQESVQVCLRYGAAIAALKYSLAGDLPLIDRHQVLDLVQSGNTQSVLR
jgi:2-dehydro-3-deoxygluconokinase